MIIQGSEMSVMHIKLYVNIMRGRVWDSKVDDILRERYTDESNTKLAEELGYSLRTIERHAAVLGLHKSEEYIKAARLKGSREGVRQIEYLKITGRKRKLSRPGGRPFQKGHKLDPKHEEKRISAIRKRAWEDRIRIIHGIRPIARWNYNLNAYKNLKKTDND